MITIKKLMSGIKKSIIELKIKIINKGFLSVMSAKWIHIQVLIKKK